MKTHLPRLAAAMTPFPYSTTPDASLDDARALLAEHGFHHLPVVADGAVVGLVHGERLAPTTTGSVAEHCRPVACVVDIETPLAELLEQMVAAHADAAVVLRHGHLAGVFTATDACRAFAVLLRELSPEPGDDLVA
ncbi:MAG: CBS domain-containing protein [Gammaproteobacteria bacterium]|nr:CBS domain-containing protein [Planctomycetota bacterium]MCB1747854.1 CBS domain-containing protein [Gammaproteobacteria bacterium]MCP5201543.1 CBS domain-containing protein [Gammaproteobacteria bacterium]